MSQIFKKTYWTLLCLITAFFSIQSFSTIAYANEQLDDWLERFNASSRPRQNHLSFENSADKDKTPGVYQRPAVWSQAALMRALVEVHKGYNDDTSLRELADGADYMFKYTSEKLGFVDVLQNRTLPAWGTGYYSCDKYRVSAVHTGVLSYPIAYFARVVLSNPTKYATEYYTRSDSSVVSMLDLAMEFLVEANRAVKSHEEQFHAASGTYRFPSNVSEIGSCEEMVIAGRTKKLYVKKDFSLADSKPLPNNMSLAMGLAHIELENAFRLVGNTAANTEADWHLERATKLAETFKSDTNLGSNGQALDWRYRKFNVDGSVGRYEDVGHAGLVLAFVIRMFEESYVFNEADIEEFVDVFNEITVTPAAVHTHVDFSYGGAGSDAVKQRKAQRGIVGWTSLALVEPEVYDETRRIFYEHQGGFDENNWYAEALLLRFSPKDIQYPILARSPSDHKSYIPSFAMRYRNATGLYRSSDVPVTTVAGKSVSSCAEYVFPDSQFSPFEIRYREVQSTGSLDSCTGGGCGTSPGFHVFTANASPMRVEDVAQFSASFELEENGWTHATTLPMDASGTWLTGFVNAPESYNRVLLCRSGAGSARDNISVRYLGIPLVERPAIVHDFNFKSSTQGWQYSSCPDFSDTHQSGNSGHSVGFLRIEETRTYEPEETREACRPVETGGHDIAYFNDFANFGNGFKVRGWTRFKSDYGGTSSVNNRCIKLINADDPSQILGSKCHVWTGINDTGWRYFDYDFTAQVQDVANVRVVVGAFDSWRKNWKQTLSIDDVQVEVAP